MSASWSDSNDPTPSDVPAPRRSALTTAKPWSTHQAGSASRVETRRRLLEAAGHEFAEGGYAAATVTRIAARAGVTVQTLYLAWGSKRALLRAYMEAALLGKPKRPTRTSCPA